LCLLDIALFSINRHYGWCLICFGHVHEVLRRCLSNLPATSMSGTTKRYSCQQHGLDTVILVQRHRYIEHLHLCSF
jgi:hypothetical protein